MKTFRRLTSLSLATSIVQTSLGAFVRTSGSGLGCGRDWPKCRGSWIPPLQVNAIIEYLHRLTASVLGFLILAVAIMAWLRFRSSKTVFRPAIAALVLVLFQGWLGQKVVSTELARRLVALHFFIAMSLVALLVLLLANVDRPRGGGLTPSFKVALGVCAVVFASIMAGALVAQAGAGLIFKDWPLMNGSIAPNFGAYREVLHWSHRLLALAAGISVVYLALIARSNPGRRPLLVAARGAVVFWTVQVALGALNVFLKAPPWVVVLHVLFGSLLWATTLWITIAAYKWSDAPPIDHPSRSGMRGPLESAKAYFLLTKPRIIELLLITTVPSMVIAYGGWPKLGLLFATVLGGSLSAGAANAINCYLDRDIDAEMDRTSIRPLPRHQIYPRRALAFGIILGIVGFLWLYVIVNPLAAWLSTSALLFYVFVYTKWIKRATPSNIVIGGAAGAVPVLVGWAAVRGTLGLPALILFGIVFYWTPPHFWALALRYERDYAKAGVPMLPVVRGTAETTKQMVIYSIALFAMSLLLVPMAGAGMIYLMAALFLGIAFIFHCWRLHQVPNARRSMSVFRHSITYLTILFAAIVADVIWRISLNSQIDRAIFLTALSVVLIGQGAILAAVFGYRRPQKEVIAPGGSVLVELAWTSVPLLGLALLSLGSWQAILR